MTYWSFAVVSFIIVSITYMLSRPTPYPHSKQCRHQGGVVVREYDAGFVCVQPLPLKL